MLRERASSDAVGVKYGDTGCTLCEHMREASTRAAALLALAEDDRPLHAGVLMGNTQNSSIRYRRRYVLAGINNTRRGEALASDDGSGWSRLPVN